MTTLLDPCWSDLEVHMPACVIAGRTPRPACSRAGRLARPTSLLILCVLALVAGSAPAGAAHAAGKPSPAPTVLWGISPTAADPTQVGTRTTFGYLLAKGGTVTDRVTIWNEGDQPLPLRLYATDALDTADGKFGIIPADQRPTGVGTWVTFLERTVIVPPHSGHVTPFTLRVPEVAGPGDHAGAIVAMLQTPQSEPNGHQVLVQQQVAAPVYVRVAGRLVPQLSVSVSAHYHRRALALGGGSLDVGYTVRNVGNVRLAAHQSLEVAAPFGITMKTVHLPDLPELLPGAKLTQVAHVHGVLPVIRVTAIVHLDPFSKSTVGPQPKAPPASGSSSVWAIPWLWLLALLLVGLYLWQRRARSGSAPAQGSPTPAPPAAPVAPEEAVDGAEGTVDAPTEPQPTGSG